MGLNLCLSGYGEKEQGRQADIQTFLQVDPITKM